MRIVELDFHRYFLRYALHWERTLSRVFLSRQILVSIAPLDFRLSRSVMVLVDRVFNTVGLITRWIDLRGVTTFEENITWLIALLHIFLNTDWHMVFRTRLRVHLFCIGYFVSFILRSNALLGCRLWWRKFLTFWNLVLLNIDLVALNEHVIDVYERRVVQILAWIVRVVSFSTNFIFQLVAVRLYGLDWLFNTARCEAVLGRRTTNLGLVRSKAVQVLVLAGFWT